VTPAPIVGWSLTTNCSSTVSLQAAQTVTCDIHAIREGSIIIRAITIPDSIDATFVFKSSLDDLTGSIGGGITELSAVNVVPGTYTVTQDPLAGFDVTAISCSNTSVSPSTGSVKDIKATIRIDPAETVICTFTNTQRAKITVIVTEEGSSSCASTPARLTGPAPFPAQAFTATCTTSQDVLVPPGSGYAVTLNSIPDTQFVQNCTAMTVIAGDQVNCYVRIVHKGTIVVDVVPNPISAATFSYTGVVNGQASYGAPLTSATQVPGVYSVVQSVQVNYTLTGISCNGTAIPNLAGASASITLAAGQTVLCRFFNRQIVTQTPNVQKITVIANVAPTSTQNFNFAINGPTPTTLTVAGGGSSQSSSLDVGTYTIIPTIPTGWVLVSTNCSTSVVLNSNDAKSCSFNFAQTGSIVIKAVCNPPSAGTFQYSGLFSASIAVGAERVTSSLAPSTYVVREAAPGTGYTLTGITCNGTTWTSDVATRNLSISLPAATTIVCTFFHRYDTTNIPSAPVTVTKTVGCGPIGANSFTFEVRKNAVLTKKVQTKCTAACASSSSASSTSTTDATTISTDNDDAKTTSTTDQVDGTTKASTPPPATTTSTTATVDAKDGDDSGATSTTTSTCSIGDLVGTYYVSSNSDHFQFDLSTTGAYQLCEYVPANWHTSLCYYADVYSGSCSSTSSTLLCVNFYYDGSAVTLNIDNLYVSAGTSVGNKDDSSHSKVSDTSATSKTDKDDSGQSTASATSATSKTDGDDAGNSKNNTVVAKSGTAKPATNGKPSSAGKTAGVVAGVSGCVLGAGAIGLFFFKRKKNRAVDVENQAGPQPNQEGVEEEEAEPASRG